MSSDERPCVYVDAAVNPDEVRVFYELPEALVNAVKGAVGGGGKSDTFTLDQALHALFEELNRIAAEFGLADEKEDHA